MAECAANGVPGEEVELEDVPGRPGIVRCPLCGEMMDEATLELVDG